MNLIIALLLALSLPFYHYSSIKIYQLSYYRLGEFLHALCKKKAKWFLVGTIAPVIAYALSVLFVEVTKKSICIALFVTMQSLIVGVYSYKTEKIKVNFTARLIRFTVLFVLLSFGLFYFITPLANTFSLLLVFLSPISFFVTHLVITPYEKTRNTRFIKRAKSRLDSINPVRIGITGSYGKTTTKNMLLEMLSKKYKTFATPQNYNTPMGIAKAIMEMSEETEVFIAEMGARYKGDIEEICDLVNPHYAILTAIGNQHLETFGSEEALIKTKSAIIDATANGICVINADCVDLKKVCLQNNCVISSEKSNFARYSAVKYSNSGTIFTLTLGNESIMVETKLLGKHIPSCVCACACLSKILGISAIQIKKAVKDLKPVAHRLELLYNGSDIIIDDAYNANEEGAKSALEVLSAFSPRIRVLITPGIVELGERQYEVNKKLGEYANGRCDYALFIGPNGVALYDGATSKGMENSFVYSTLVEALEKLKTIKGERAILFENDLPDEK